MSSKPFIHVAAGILINASGHILLAERAFSASFYPGYWEFPGGKLEAGETPKEALVRELNEELGITVRKATPWITRTASYEHITVCLHFFRVTDWEGILVPHVHETLQWVTLDQAEYLTLLPPNRPILSFLAFPSVFAITGAHLFGINNMLAMIQKKLSHQQVRLIQIREKELLPSEKQFFTQQTIELCRQYQATCLYNAASMDDIAYAHTLTGLSGVHLTAALLHNITIRPDFPVVGASCHTLSDIQKANLLFCDYIYISPVCATKTHPEEEPIGWENFAALLKHAQMPVFALGGMMLSDIPLAQHHGAHGIAGIGHIWQTS